MDLFTCIQAHTPFDAAEERHKALMLHYLAHSKEDLFLRPPHAHFTASAMVLSPNCDAILLLHHNIYQSWTWPGGHSDGERDLLHTAKKEVMEETGLKAQHLSRGSLIALDVIPVLAHYKKGAYVANHLHLNLTYSFVADVTAPLHINARENSAVMWVPFNELWEKTKNEPHMQKIYKKGLIKMGII
ncbi:MAG: NUDIX domain-containing protein [Clostridiales bacterium]|nr:NUDIX domain-containing protein [Clostridiales bacterium]